MAQLVDMAIVGIITGLAIWLVGGSNWLLIGAITAVLEFVPYLGPIIAGALAVLITVQQLEGHLITPLVLKEGVNLPPVQLLIFVTIMGSLFGIMGVLVASAVFAVGRTAYLMTYAMRMDLGGQEPGEKRAA